MKKIPRHFFSSGIILILIFSIVFSTGCAEDNRGEEVNSSFTVTDDRGIEFTFDSPVESIVSLAPSNTEIVCFVDAIDKLIARTDYCNYPADVSTKESIGGYSKPDKERVVILNPDVILATSIHVSNGDVDWLEDQGLKVLVLNPADIDGIMANIEMVGILVGNEAAAKQKISELQDRIKYVTDRTSVLSENEKPRVLHVTWHDPLWTTGSGTHLDAVIKLAGGVNIFSDTVNDVQVDVELAVTRNPQIITVVTGHGDAMETSYNYVIAEDSPFVKTDAFINNQVFLIDADLATRPGPRIVDALEQFAKFVHPEIFP